jgi:hypothetical protein
MAPEQASARADLDERCDIYALGGVLYSVLHLRPPLRKSEVNEMLASVRAGKIEPFFLADGVGPADDASRRITPTLAAVVRRRWHSFARTVCDGERFGLGCRCVSLGFATTLSSLAWPAILAVVSDIARVVGAYFLSSCLSSSRPNWSLARTGQTKVPFSHFTAKRWRRIANPRRRSP